MRKGNPSQRIKVIGVTGTRGKTEVTELIYHILQSAGLRVGYLSSTGYSAHLDEFGDDLNANYINAGELHELLDEMIDSNLEYAIIEMPANNIAENKYEGIFLDSGVITNILGDDRAYFKSFEDYAKTKLNFISKIRDKGLLILNGDEPQGLNWLQSHGDYFDQEIFMYPVTTEDVEIEQSGLENGVTFRWDGTRIKHPNFHKNTVSNTLQALKLAQSYKPDPKLHNHIETFEAPKGRMEIFQTVPYTVIIDYAYTPSMLDESLSHIFELKDPNARIISVFGCAGERDTSRREMGLVSMQYSDLTILTAEDPKSESVYNINSEIFSYVEGRGGMLVERFSSPEEYKLANKENLKQRIERVIQNDDQPFVAFDAEDFTSRLDAINFAVQFAKHGDIIYITGKSDEATIAFDGIEYEWSDYEAVKMAMKS